MSLLQGEYESLAKKLSEYVVKLLDHVRGNDELDIILNEPVEGHGPECQGKLARLKLAIKCNEKQVRATTPKKNPAKQIQRDVRDNFGANN